MLALDVQHRLTSRLDTVSYIVFDFKTMNGTSTDLHQLSTATSVSTGFSFDADVALLTSLLSQSSTHPSADGDVVDERDIEGPELQELLRCLETADGIARGMESRLDDFIGNLDRMLGSLERAKEGTGEELGEAGTKDAGMERKAEGEQIAEPAEETRS